MVPVSVGHVVLCSILWEEAGDAADMPTPAARTEATASSGTDIVNDGDMI